MSMSFGENLQFLRKSRNMTQEELAESLNVSRQSVSKWESDSSFPEMDKVIQLSDIFGCDIDTLIKDNVEKEFSEDNAGYDKHMTNFAKANSTAVGLLIFGIALRGFCDGLRLNETLSDMGFFVFILISIMIFVVTGMTHTNFRKNNPKIVPFYKPEQIKNFEDKLPVRMAAGIGIVILGVILSIGIDGMEKTLLKDALENSAMLLCVSIGVPIITYNGMLKDKFNIDKYNKGNSTENKKSKYSKWYGIIMILAAIFFCVTGIIWNWWDYNWLAFVVGGLLCGIVAIVDNSQKD